MQVVVNPKYRATSATSRPQSVRAEEGAEPAEEGGSAVGSADVLDRGYSKVSFVGMLPMYKSFVNIVHRLYCACELANIIDILQA